MINYFIWLIAGAVIGGMTTWIIRRRHPLMLPNILVGSVGAFLAGFLLLPLLKISTISFSFLGLLVSLGSAIILLAVVNFFVRERTMANIVMQDQWDRVQRKVHYRWSKITEKDVEQIDGNHDRLIGLIQERYGVSNVEAEDQLQKFLRAVVT